MRRSYLTALFSLSALVVLTLSLAGCGDDRYDPSSIPGSGTITPQYSQDVRMYEDALAQDPNNPQLLIQLGNKYYDWGVAEINQKGDMAEPAGKWQKAIEYYRRALDVDPNNVDVRTDMANLIQWLGDIEMALSEYRTGKQINPKHPQTRINLVLLLAEGKQDYKAAVKEYEELIKAIPEQANNMELKAEVDRYRELAKEAKK